jgi:predicted membrane-bound mannosyltransferase
MSPPDGDGPAVDSGDDPAGEPANAPRSPDAGLPALIRRMERRLVRLERRTGLDRVVLGLLAIAALGLVLRFVGLGTRVAHWDEARVLYWVSHYQETGHFAYRRIIHGPFIQLVNQLLFSLFGPSDWIARAPVALVGSLVPL